MAVIFLNVNFHPATLLHDTLRNCSFTWMEQSPAPSNYSSFPPHSLLLPSAGPFYSLQTSLWVHFLFQTKSKSPTEHLPTSASILEVTSHLVCALMRLVATCVDTSRTVCGCDSASRTQRGCCEENIWYLLATVELSSITFIHLLVIVWTIQRCWFLSKEKHHQSEAMETWNKFYNHTNQMWSQGTKAVCDCYHLFSSKEGVESCHWVGAAWMAGLQTTCSLNHHYGIGT